MDAPFFAAVFPGSPLTTAFQPLPDAPTKLLLRVPDVTVNEFALSLLRSDIPPGTAIGVYMVVHPAQEWQFVGALTLARPSAIFPALWNATATSTTRPTEVLIGVSIDPETEVLNLEPQVQHAKLQGVHNTAVTIVQHIFNYLSSFSQTGAQGEVIQLPFNVFQRWIAKFESKLRNDPNFLFRQ